MTTRSAQEPAPFSPNRTTADLDLLALMPYAVVLGVQLDSDSAEQAIGHLPWAPQQCTAGGVLQGGALIGLAESDRCDLRLSRPARRSQHRHYRLHHPPVPAVRDGWVTATSIPLHRGSTLIVIQTDLTDSHSRLVAQVTQTQAVLS